MPPAWLRASLLPDGHGAPRCDQERGDGVGRSAAACVRLFGAAKTSPSESNEALICTSHARLSQHP